MDETFVFIYLLKSIIIIYFLISFIVNSGNILTGGDNKNERERLQREL